MNRHIPIADNTNFLGLIFDRKLIWKQHIEKVIGNYQNQQNLRSHRQEALRTKHQIATVALQNHSPLTSRLRPYGLRNSREDTHDETGRRLESSTASNTRRLQNYPNRITIRRNRP